MEVDDHFKGNNQSIISAEGNTIPVFYQTIHIGEQYKEADNIRARWCTHQTDGIQHVTEEELWI